MQDDPRKRKPDISLAKRELKWSPKVSCFLYADLFVLFIFSNYCGHQPQCLIVFCPRILGVCIQQEAH